MIGIGAPQNRWRLSNQSRSRKFTSACPLPSASSQAITLAIEAGEGSPSNGPLLTMTPVVRQRLGHRGGVDRLRALGLDHDRDGQVVLARELEVALVVRRHRHDRAGAVLHQHVGRGVHRHPLAVHRVHGVDAQEHAVLGVGVLAIHQRGGPGLFAQRRHLIRRAAQLGQALHRRMLDREHEERDAPQGVGARGEDLDLLAGLGDREGHTRAFAAPDPVALHRDDALGPVDQVVHVVQQPLGVVGDLEEPLGQVAALHHRAAALARPLDHLLVRQHRLVVADTS